MAGDFPVAGSATRTVNREKLSLRVFKALTLHFAKKCDTADKIGGIKKPMLVALSLLADK